MEKIDEGAVPDDQGDALPAEPEREPEKEESAEPEEELESAELPEGHPPDSEPWPNGLGWNMGESVEIVKTRGGYEVLIRDEDGIGIKSWKGQAANPKAAGLLAMKYAKPFDDGPEPTFSVEMALHVVADSWEKLRPVDVERPLDGQDAERRSIMAGAIIEHRPDLRKRVLGVLAIAEVYSVFPIGLNLQHQ